MVSVVLLSLFGLLKGMTILESWIDPCVLLRIKVIIGQWTRYMEEKYVHAYGWVD